VCDDPDIKQRLIAHALANRVAAHQVTHMLVGPFRLEALRNSNVTSFQLFLDKLWPNEAIAIEILQLTMKGTGAMPEQYFEYGAKGSHSVRKHWLDRAEVWYMYL